MCRMKFRTGNANDALQYCQRTFAPFSSLRWYIDCRRLASSAALFYDCFSTGWQNNFDDPLDYSAPGHYVLNGVQSYHSNNREDRRYACVPG